MGELSVKPAAESRNKFIRALVRDIEALDQMLHEGLFEKGQQRVGAEQEIFLANGLGQPSKEGPGLLEVLPSAFTTEIGRYNLEVNLDPFSLDGQAFQKTEKQLREMLGILDKEAAARGIFPLLTGILPTLRRCHLELQYMTPQIRYSILSEAMRRRRGSDFEIHIQGADELIARLDSVMFEACNTSWQMHLQIPPELFAEQYNWAGAGRLRQFSATVRPRIVARDADRALSAKCGYPKLQQPRAQQTEPGGFRAELAYRPGLQPVQRQYQPLPIAPDQRSEGRRVGGARKRSGAPTEGASPAQRNGIQLEPPLLWHQRIG